MSDAALPSQPAPDGTRTRAPTAIEQVRDKVFRNLTFCVAWLSVGVLVLIIYEVGRQAAPSVKEHGLSLVTSKDWSPNDGQYGLLPHIFGTVFSAVLALIIATILGVGVAIFITEDFLHPKVRTVLKNVVELLAAIPSVIFGLWGLEVLGDFLKVPADWLHSTLGWIPLFSTTFNGSTGMLPAAVVLAIMILPTITALARDAIANVPSRLREGAVGLGATRWEVILKIVLPTASTGIYGAIIIAFGRAVGETMALAILVGNANEINWSIMAPANTLAALMANNFSEAVNDTKYLGALMYAGLLLMVITLVVNILGSVVIMRAAEKLKGLR